MLESLIQTVGCLALPTLYPLVGDADVAIVRFNSPGEVAMHRRPGAPGLVFVTWIEGFNTPDGVIDESEIHRLLAQLAQGRSVPYSVAYCGGHSRNAGVWPHKRHSATVRGYMENMACA